MYNRYIPQSDGSYRRSRQGEPPKDEQSPPPQAQPFPEPQPQEHSHINRDHSHVKSVPSFLRQLLPKDFDTGDLIVMLLLLLMAGDKEEDRADAILTMALYLLM